MRTVRSSRRNSRPGRPIRSSIVGVGGGGGGGLSSAGVPTLTTSNSAAGTTNVTVNPVNWGGQVGDDIVIVGYYEAFNGTFGTTVDDWSFAPDEGTVYKIAAGDDGTQTHGCLFAWVINAATTTGGIALNPSHTDADLNNCACNVLVYRNDTITVGIEAGAFGMESPVTDVGDWTYGGSSDYNPPDPVAVTDGTDWFVMACAGSGDDGSFTQKSTTYDNIYQTSITTGADSAVGTYVLEGQASLSMTTNHDVVNTDFSSTIVSRAFGWLFVGTV